MQTMHFQKFQCSGDTFKTIRALMKEAEWQPGSTRGFGMVGEDPNVIHGALYSEVAHTLKAVFDPNKRTEEDEVVRRLGRKRFILDFKRGQLSVHNRADFKPVIEALDALPGVVFSTADYKLNVFELLEQVGKGWAKLDITKLGVSDFIEGKHNLIADVGFKPADQREVWNAARKYKDQLKAFALTIKGDKNLKFKCAVNSRGAVAMSEEAPTDFRDYVLGLLNTHDTEGEAAAPVERHGFSDDPVELGIDKMRATVILRHAKNEKDKAFAQSVIDAIDKRLSGQVKAADEATAKAIRELRKAAKKCGGLEITSGGKTVKVA